jgi:hypothetical protein
LKPAQANRSQDPISKKPSQERAGGIAQGVGPEFKCQYHTHTKKKPCSTPNPSVLLKILPVPFMQIKHIEKARFTQHMQVKTAVPFHP